MADNSNAGFVEFKKDTCVYFDENGFVTAGTIKEAAPKIPAFILMKTGL